MFRLLLKYASIKQFMFKDYSLKVLLMLLIVFESSSFFSYKGKAEGLFLVNSLSYECFTSRQFDTCATALEKVQELQVLSGSNENYLCQTRLLGLESKIIMIMMRLPKRKDKYYIKNLSGVKEVCSTSNSVLKK